MAGVSAVVFLAFLLGAGAAAAQDCDTQFPPRELIDAEYTRLRRFFGPLGCPLALEEPFISPPPAGAFQEFERGQIVWSPRAGDGYAMLAGYHKKDCGPGFPPCIVFRWKNMPDSDLFIIRFAEQEHVGYIPGEGEESQVAVLVSNRALEYDEEQESGFDVAGRVEISNNEALTRTSGAIHINADRFRAGRYKFTIAGCTRDSEGIGTTTDCDQGSSNPLFVDYEFLDLKEGLQPPPSPSLVEARIRQRRHAALSYACRRAAHLNGAPTQDGTIVATAKESFGTTALALLATEPAGTPDRFICPREGDNLTRYDTKAYYDKLQAGAPALPRDPVLGLVGNDCNSGPALPLGAGDQTTVVLKNECLVALALRSLRQTSLVGTDTYREEDGLIGALGGIILGPLGAPTGSAIEEGCEVHGDYDFELLWILRIMMLHGPASTGGDGKIDKRTWEHLLTLLTERGRGTFSRNIFVCGIPTPIGETENHLWMIESARYITNELLRRSGSTDPDHDNATNGQRRVLLEQFQQILSRDFYEFNSRPYQRLTVFAIRNLYELGWRQIPDDPIPRAAEVALDYLSGRYALSTNGLRRVANFRRLERRAQFPVMFQALGDSELGRMTLLSGTSIPLLRQRFGRVHPYEVEPMIFHGTGRRYRVPELVRDYLVRGVEHSSPQDVLQRFRSMGSSSESGLEVHFSTPRFTLSAGGIASPMPGGESAAPLPTALILTDAGRGWHEMVRFNGAPYEDTRFNTCVGPNFACGIDPVAPSNIPAGCIERRGNWTFINFNSTSPGCDRPFGVHVAIYAALCEEDGCAYGGDTWGFLEAAESTIPPLSIGALRRAVEVVAFLRFQSSVLSGNAAFAPAWRQANARNLYRTTKGRLISFNAGPLEAMEWSINHIDGTPTLEPKYWPVAQGDVMNGLPGKPCIEFDNAFQKRRLILDLRDLSKDLGRWKCEVPIARFTPGCQVANPCP